MNPPKSYLYDYNRTTAPPEYNPTTEPPKRKPKRRHEENKVEKKKRIRQQKPYLSCTWYPVECDGNCDDGRGPCGEYITSADHEAIFHNGRTV